MFIATLKKPLDFSPISPIVPKRNLWSSNLQGGRYGSHLEYTLKPLLDHHKTSPIMLV